jgi:hypothetical protein
VVLNLLFNRPPAERAAPLPSAVPPPVSPQ